MTQKNELPEKPILFLLEDNQDLTNRVLRVAKRIGWSVVSARSMEGAQRICTEENGPFHAALVDLMIPRTEDDLNVVDELLEQRTKIGRDLVGREAGRGQAKGEQDRQRLLAELNEIDQRIRTYIQDDGGIQFLRSIAAQERIVNSGVIVAVFTAREIDAVADSDAGITVHDAVMRALMKNDEKDGVMWFEKPVSPLDLEAWLRGVTKHRRTDEMI